MKTHTQNEVKAAMRAAGVRSVRALKLTASCAVCGEPFNVLKDGMIYCSKKCGSRAWRDRSYQYTTLQCKQCGNDFKRITSSQRYCSRDCQKSAEAKRRKRVGGPGKGWSGGKSFKEKDKVCERCGVEFHASPSNVARGQYRFCSNSCRTANIASNPRLFPQVCGRRGRTGTRTDLGFFVRSSWEANWARYLKWLVDQGQIKDWDYECKTFQFHKISRGSRFYTPDFLITNNDGSTEWHEVKGYMDQKSRTKLKRMAKYYPEEKITVISSKEYTAIKKTMSKVIPNWE